jgi:hypothetical protein
VVFSSAYLGQISWICSEHNFRSRYAISMAFDFNSSAGERTVQDGSAGTRPISAAQPMIYPAKRSARL